MNKKSKVEIKEIKNLVDKKELNLWKRGFTPQAEIWNGRMATVGIGLILVVSVLVLYFLFRYLIWYFDTYIGPAWL